MARDLDADLTMLKQVLALAQRRDVRAAAALAEPAVAAGFEHPLLLNVLATRLEQDGRFEEAVRLLERAVAVAPEDVPARNALALALQRVDRPADALRHVDELLRREPGLAFAHANRGNALISLGQLASARAAHLRALELDPDSLAAMAALASIATHRGEHSEGRVWAERLIARVPGYPDAVLSLAAAELDDGQPGRAESLLRGVLGDARAGVLDKARAEGQLGDVLDALGRYREAFAAYRSCNEALRAANARYARETSILDYTRALTVAFRAVASRWPARPPQSRDGPAARHVFLIGFPRSGTTLLEVVLDGHPEVRSLEEHELLTPGVLRYLADSSSLAPLAVASEADLEPLRAAYWAEVASAGVDVRGTVFIDKHPLNTLKLPLIARLFPDAQILFGRRDPRDVVLSCFRRRFKMNAAMYQLLTLDGAAQFYAAAMDYVAAVRPSLGLGWRDVVYEELMQDFTAQMQAICAFLGIVWNDNMGSFAERVRLRAHSTPSTAQLSRGLDPSRVAHWRHYAAELASVENVLGPWI